MNHSEMLQRVLNASNHDELMDAYKEWAADYDDQLLKDLGYKAHAVSADLLTSYLESKNARILDAGCGTGLVGEVLKKEGCTNMDALDYSAEMLEEAGKKSIYKELMQADLTKPLNIETNAYDAIVCVGTFTLGHVGPEAFPELVRIVKPGGYICFTVREAAYEQHDYRRNMLELEVRNAWELLELRTAPYMEHENAMCKVVLYKVMK